MECETFTVTRLTIYFLCHAKIPVCNGGFF